MALFQFKKILDYLRIYSGNNLFRLSGKSSRSDRFFLARRAMRKPIPVFSLRKPTKRAQNKKPPFGGFLYNSAPCYFPTNECSIVTATRLNFCVRHGNRWVPRAMGTDFGICVAFPASQRSCLRWKAFGESLCQFPCADRFTVLQYGSRSCSELPCASSKHKSQKGSVPNRCPLVWR